jgi:hypothetical protein
MAETSQGERKVVLRGTSPGLDGAVLVRQRTGKPLNNLELVERLCAVSAALTEARLVHVRNLGSLVPHVFMGDVLERVRQCMANAPREVDAILAVLEAAAEAADRETRQVIAASFVHDGQREPFFSQIRPRLGRGLQALLRAK